MKENTHLQILKQELSEKHENFIATEGTFDQQVEKSKKSGYMISDEIFFLNS